MSHSDFDPHELLQKAANFFERHGVPYRVVGGMASIAYGEARFTNDVDILVDMDDKLVEALSIEFAAPEFYLSVPAAREAIRRRRQFNIIHVSAGFKLDIIQRRDTEFSLADITHGQRLKSEGRYDAWFASPENVILMKLRYYQEGVSEKHLRDIASMLLVQDTAIDREYIASWAQKLGVAQEWNMILDRLAERANGTDDGLGRV